MKVEKIKYAMGKLIAEGALVYDDSVSGKRPAMLMALKPPTAGKARKLCVNAWVFTCAICVAAENGTLL